MSLAGNLQTPSGSPGDGSIVLENFCGALQLSKLAFVYPLKLVAPRATSRCQSVFVLSYGGGLVGGDAITLHVHLKMDTTISLMTQGSTKIFKARAGMSATTQSIRVELDPRATCILIPDPVQPFAGSSYIQNQRFSLASDANLILLDWFLSGRPANDEIWDFKSFTSINSIYSEVDGAERLMVRDSQIMREGHVKLQMGSYHCLGTLLFTGPLTEDASLKILAQFKNETRLQSSKVRRAGKGRSLYTVTKHRAVTIVKLAGWSSESVKEDLSGLIDVFGWRSLFGADAFRALD